MLTQLDLRNIIRIEENRKEVNKMNARIEAVRKHEGLTQEQFADRINLSVIIYGCLKMAPEPQRPHDQRHLQGVRRPGSVAAYRRG